MILHYFTVKITCIIELAGWWHKWLNWWGIQLMATLGFVVSLQPQKKKWLTWTCFQAKWRNMESLLLLIFHFWFQTSWLELNFQGNSIQNYQNRKNSHSIFCKNHFLIAAVSILFSVGSITCWMVVWDERTGFIS